MYLSWLANTVSLLILLRKRLGIIHLENEEVVKLNSFVHLQKSLSEDSKFSSQ